MLHEVLAHQATRVGETVRITARGIQQEKPRSFNRIAGQHYRARIDSLPAPVLVEVNDAAGFSVAAHGDLAGHALQPNFHIPAGLGLRNVGHIHARLGADRATHMASSGANTGGTSIPVP